MSVCLPPTSNQFWGDIFLFDESRVPFQVKQSFSWSWVTPLSPRKTHFPLAGGWRKQRKSGRGGCMLRALFVGLEGVCTAVPSISPWDGLHPSPHSRTAGLSNLGALADLQKGGRAQSQVSLTPWKGSICYGRHTWQMTYFYPRLPQQPSLISASQSHLGQKWNNPAFTQDKREPSRWLPQFSWKFAPWGFPSEHPEAYWLAVTSPPSYLKSSIKSPKRTLILKVQFDEFVKYVHLSNQT